MQELVVESFTGPLIRIPNHKQFPTDEMRKTGSPRVTRFSTLKKNLLHRRSCDKKNCRLLKALCVIKNRTTKHLFKIYVKPHLGDCKFEI